MSAPTEWAAITPLMVPESEPGPDVTHVRDTCGVVWRRQDGVWWADIGHGYEVYRQWHDLLRRGTLSDASGDVR